MGKQLKILRLFSQALVLAKIFAVKASKAVYDCARQPRRGLWKTSMDLPSSYSVSRFANQELTD